MNKETRLFINGFFWMLLGSFVVYSKIEMYATRELLWYDYLGGFAGLCSCIRGILDIDKSLK
jgi:hypothetical protein